MVQIMMTVSNIDFDFFKTILSYPSSSYIFFTHYSFTGDIIHSLVFSPNRYWLVAATTVCIKIWDLESKGKILVITAMMMMMMMTIILTNTASTTQ